MVKGSMEENGNQIGDGLSEGDRQVEKGAGEA